MNKFSVKDRIKSFSFALKGIKLLFRHEHNAWIHCTLAIFAIGLGWYFQVSSTEWMFIVVSIAMVLSAEAFNTAIEKMADFIQPDQDQRIEHIKDISAGAVLFAAFTALVVGLLIFLPKIFSVINI